MYHFPEKWNDYLHPNDKKTIEKSILQRNCQVKQEDKFLTEYRIIRPSGEIRYILDASFPIIANKIHIGFAGIARDVAQLQALEKAKRKAEIANRAKAEFLRNMEHQLRTPFSGVYSLVEMLAAQESDPKKKELLNITYSSGKELLDFLNDVLKFANEPSEKIVLAKKFDLKQLIDNAIVMEKPAAVMKGLDLSAEYPATLPTIFISNPKRIQRIVLNLLSNALKFTTEGRIKVTVKLGKQLDAKHYILRLTVTDTGIGIAKENQATIYEKFYRVSPANQSKYTGAGLGLHIVKEFITDLDGEIDVKSELGKGTSFICTLPFKRPLLDEIIAESYN